ncbi:oxysterol-binding protein-related protein 3-like isoform X2 [Pieris brassicae]|uniref:oxysterol-binding protein-related protein 3-like isoform X2 n=1 Tax=Pieris brassicae TaxID=7116 RepID=UPI001E662053|nr:oxysterol-binding protein-related protein 3-like isoform X2 [Pieris brassicae]
MKMKDPLSLLNALRWLVRNCNTKMSNQTGLKHVATEPTRLESKRERRRGAAGRAAALRRAPSDSDCSGETASLSADSGERSVRPLPPPPRTGKSRGRRRGSEWEVLEGLKDGQRFDKRPEVFNGYLHKKRKWPLKGWHKRFFVVDGGILVYARSPSDVARGRLHGSVDVGLSVISAKARRRRIDIDADEFIYHLRAKTPEVFRTWLNVLKTHRLYRQHLLTFGARESVPKIHAPIDDLPPTDTSSRLVSPTSGPLRGPQAGFVSGTPGGRLASWIIESGAPLDTVTRELGQAQLSVQQLQRLLDALELQQQTHHDTDVSMDGASPNVKKDRRKFGLRKKKSNSKCATVEPSHIDPSSSHMALSTLTAPPSPGGGASSVPNSAASLPIAFFSTFLASTLVPCAATRPQSLPGAEVLNAAPASFTSLTPDHQLREDFTVLAKDLITNLKSIVATLVCERGRLRAAMESAESTAAPSGVVAALRTNLSTALQQNSVLRTELRSRLSRIHDASDLAEISSMGANSDHIQFKHSPSYSSSCVSASEFFDAEEYDNGEVKENNLINADETGVIELDGDSSSEAGSLSSEEGSASSDNSDAAMVAAEQIGPTENGGEQWSRRRVLPAPRPTPGGPSLWNLLYKNIGKDLSQISMPVTINEPLNMLQRLCEELEYSELLDSASACDDPVNRMALVAAFAVSSYAASAHRAASKPFNPLLGETYECVREDKGFKFLAEQVSHHPPISACHAVSSRWVFWQEARIKTKFWGKSMEFQPAGRVHLVLLPTGDHYTWNKVTTCVHNLFGGQRWVDQYGDMLITCQGSDISCKLHFVKASSWSSTRHEVRGAVYSKQTSHLRLHGRWSEALYAGEPPAARCLWRPGAMPPDYELYYGFTRFAMELNEMEPGLKDILPHTDTRFRPDQRALEEGDVDAAEQFKHELEQSQRERRRDRPDHMPAWFRKSTEGGEETWVYGGEYWRAQADGYMQLHTPRLW